MTMREPNITELREAHESARLLQRVSGEIAITTALGESFADGGRDNAGEVAIARLRLRDARREVEHLQGLLWPTTP